MRLEQERECLHAVLWAFWVGASPASAENCPVAAREHDVVLQPVHTLDWPSRALALVAENGHQSGWEHREVESSVSRAMDGPVHALGGLSAQLCHGREIVPPKRRKGSKTLRWDKAAAIRGCFARLHCKALAELCRGAPDANTRVRTLCAAAQGHHRLRHERIFVPPHCLVHTLCHVKWNRARARTAQLDLVPIGELVQAARSSSSTSTRERQKALHCCSDVLFRVPRFASASAEAHAVVHREP
mmetsp:Transcript_16642/g.53024  ORF Transcript_16642/g.53024 Transcript_16642/m.53024 type:complete len:244 (+) Transcript_16642:1329-2060(+)